MLTFGEIDVGTVSPASAVTITNSGALVALSPSVQGAAFGIVSTTCGIPAASCTISVAFSPTSLGAASGTLTIAAGLTVSLSGMGTPVGTFTVVALGVPSTQLANVPAPITVRVTATDALTGLSCVVSGPDLTADAAQTTCSGNMVANTPCVYAYTFKSATPGEKTDSVVCTAGTEVKSVLVNPTVVTPASLTIAPNPGTFAAVANSTNFAVTFNVGNVGGSASGALTPAIAGANASEFAITSNTCIVPLDSHLTCAIQVTFTPTSIGTKAATLTLTDATPGSTPAATTLTGMATGVPTAGISGSGSIGNVVVGKAGTPVTLTITNSGGGTTGTLAVAATDPQFAIGSDLCTGATLAAGKTCTFAVTFTPTSTGPKSAVVSVSSAGTVLGTLPLSGTGTAPPTPAVLTMTPPKLDFGTIGVGTPGTPQTFTVANTGGLPTGTLTVTNVGVGGASQFTHTTTCQAALAPAATCQIVVTYAPTVTGNASATITVSDGTISAAQSAVGTALDRPGISITCTPSDFGSIGIGQTSATSSCKVSNNANSPQATGTITATPSADFIVSTNNCTASLAPGTSCTLAVAFKPTAAGSRTGSITVTGANGGTANQVLTGTGLGLIEIREYTAPGAGSIVPTLVSAGNYDFGSGVNAGATSATTMTLAVFVRGAAGNLTVTTTNVGMTDAANADFTRTSTQAVNVDWAGTGTATSVGACVGATTTPPPANLTVPYCTMIVSFTPQTKGAKTGSVTATGADATNKSTATMAGTAAGPLSIEPSTWAFATVAQGTAGPAKTFTICNNAPSGATLTSFGITGTNAGDFAVTLDQLTSAPIAAGACVNLALRLEPAAGDAASLSATLTVRGTIAGVQETDTATLTGASAGAPSLQVSAGTFADTAITNVSGAATLTITNNGGVASGALSFSLPGGSEFAMDTGTQGTCGVNCTSAGACTAPTGLTPNGTCTLKVWFAPTPALGVGGRTDVLSVAGASGGFATRTLTANASSQIVASASTVPLGLSVVGGSGGPITTITLRNAGGADATVSSAFQDFGAQTGEAVGVFRFSPATPNCTGALAAGASCTVGVQMFTPATAGGVPDFRGPFSTTLVVTNTTNGQSADVALSGTLAQAILQFTQATNMDRDFGSLPMGNQSAPITYTVTNVGNLTSGTINWGLYDSVGATPVPHAQTLDFNTSTTCTTLAPGASCNIVVAFTPTACNPVVTGCTAATLASLTETLMVTATPGTTAAGLRRVITATTNKTQPTLYIADTSATPKKGVYDFGSTPDTATLVLYNAGNVAYAPTTAPTFTDLGLAGTRAAATGEFAIATTTTATTCQFARPSGTGGVTSLAAKGTTEESCTFNVTWNPGTTPPTGTRAVRVAVGGTSMTLFGRVLGPAVLVASPTGLDFGSVSVNGATSTLTLTVTNIGDAPTGNVGVAQAGAANNEINYSTANNPACGSGSLAAGASCNLVVTVNPGTPPAAGSATITVQSPPLPATAVSSVAVPVTWTGVATIPAAIGLSVTPAATTVNLGSVAVQTTSTPRTVTVSNPAGALPTGPLSFAVINTDFADFAVDAAGTGSCGLLTYADGLNGGQSCTVAVTFRPRAIGANAVKNATLSVSARSAPTATIALTGTAAAALRESDRSPASAAEDPRRTGSGCAGAGTCTYADTSITATTFRSETFTFLNAGDPSTGLLVADLTGTGTNAGQFEIVNDACTGASVGSGGSCKVTVRFAPNSAGAKTATLTVSGSPGDSASVTLAGTGTTP